MITVGEPHKRLRSLTACSDSFLPPVKRLRTLDQPPSTISLHRARIIFLRGGSLTRQAPYIDPCLRKIAILNRIRKLGLTVPSPNFDNRPQQLVGGIDEIAAVRLTHSQEFLPRSPLGFSNYGELDQWNGDDDDEDQFDYGNHADSDQDDDDDVFRSDFNFLDVDEDGSTDDEYHDSPFSTISRRPKPRNTGPRQETTARDCIMTSCEQNRGTICCR